ncbi:hypothetical protein Tco_1417055, partial [Tanacetum coccineum]
VAEAYGIPLDLNPQAAPPDMAMDELPADAIAFLKHWKERFFLVARRAAPIIMPLRYHDSSVADLAHLVGTYSEDDVEILRCRDCLKDTRGKVVTMAKFLRLSDWPGTKFGYADLMADGEVLATHTTLPCASNEDVLKNTKLMYLAFGIHLEEIHVTWAHLEKKRTRLRTYTNISQDYVLSGWRRRHKIHVTPTHLMTVSQDFTKASAHMT